MQKVFIYVCLRLYTITFWCVLARGQGGPRGLSPPLEIEKQKKKKSSEQILSYFTYIFATFLVKNIIFSIIF